MSIQPKILSRFLSRKFLSSIFLVSLIAFGITFAITFVEKLGGMDAARALQSAYIAVLEYIPVMLPLLIFMGSLLAYYRLIKSSEMVIISGAGLSPWNIMRPFLVVAAVLGIICTTLVNPYTIRISNGSDNANKFGLVDNSIFLRETTGDGFRTIRADKITARNDSITFGSVVMIVQDGSSRVSARIESDKITLGGGELAGEKIIKTTPDGNAAIVRNWRAPTNMTPDAITRKYLKPEQISFWQLPRFIREMKNIGINTAPHRARFWSLLFMPITLIAMAILGIAFSQTHQRRNFSFGVKFGIGIIACFLLYFILNVFSVLGAGNSIPPIIAILSPVILIITGSGTFIVSYDTV
ncbi:MAG: LptF/LptG family permease [Rickettsiales bacterium]|jgi:lipopolysaccharide export system permease protein|nr:LptF/LptG family permease [Rickettsiales bacterium]